ncbi:MAG: hypothetical protein WA708_19620 [Acidobacteriaceae bacterium]
MSKQINDELRDRTGSGSANLVVVRVGNGERDMELISSAMRDWIIPALVREFLAEHPILTSPNKVISDKRTSKPRGKEGAGPTRINPNAQ